MILGFRFYHFYLISAVVYRTSHSTLLIFFFPLISSYRISSNRISLKPRLSWVWEWNYLVAICVGLLNAEPKILFWNSWATRIFGIFCVFSHSNFLLENKHFAACPIVMSYFCSNMIEWMLGYVLRSVNTPNIPRLTNKSWQHTSIWQRNSICLTMLPPMKCEWDDLTLGMGYRMSVWIFLTFSMFISLIYVVSVVVVVSFVFMFIFDSCVCRLAFKISRSITWRSVCSCVSFSFPSLSVRSRMKIISLKVFLKILP